MLVAWDFGRWVSHMIRQQVPLLWEFHKVHHSAAVLTPITALRQHPVEWIVQGFFLSLTQGAVIAGFLYGLGLQPDPLAILGAPAIIFLWHLFGYNLRHSPIWLSYGPVLSRLMVSPAQHQIHHSTAPDHIDKNYGYVLALWDWGWGSLYVPVDREQLSYGLASPMEMARFQSVWGNYYRPFRNLIQNLRGAAHHPVEGVGLTPL